MGSGSIAPKYFISMAIDASLYSASVGICLSLPEFFFCMFIGYCPRLLLSWNFS